MSTAAAKKCSVTKVNGLLYFACPHCDGGIEVSVRDIRCQIFRHGTFVRDGRPIDPHTARAECDRLARFGLIYGCGRPFRYIYASSGFTNDYVTPCDYI